MFRKRDRFKWPGGSSAFRRGANSTDWRSRLERLWADISGRGRQFAGLLAGLVAAARARWPRDRALLMAKVAALGSVLQSGFRRVSGRLDGETPCGPCQSVREAWAALRDRVARLREDEEIPDIAEEGTYAYLFEAKDYPRSRNRNYLVHVPPDYDGETPMPLVMVLHGCRQTHRDIRRISLFDAAADRYGFLVVYPFITSYSGLRFRNCWGFWYTKETRAGAGEAEDLWQIVEQVRAQYNVDAQRIHVAGLSSGAGMTAALLVAHAGRFASGAVVAGVPYAESAGAVGFMKGSNPKLKPVYQIAKAMRAALPRRFSPIPIFVIHSRDDDTVDIQAARNIRDSWGHCFKVDTLNPVRTRSGVTRGTPWEHKAYGAQSDRSIIETFFIAGKGHGWYGGHVGPYSYPDAPDITRRIWLFFERHPR